MYIYILICIRCIICMIQRAFEAILAEKHPNMSAWYPKHVMFSRYINAKWAVNHLISPNISMFLQLIAEAHRKYIVSYYHYVVYNRARPGCTRGRSWNRAGLSTNRPLMYMYHPRARTLVKGTEWLQIHALKSILVQLICVIKQVQGKGPVLQTHISAEPELTSRRVQLITPT